MSVEYDERLLASAPAATRAEKQEGYNIDLLENGHGAAHSGSSTPQVPLPVLAPNADYAENGLRSKEVPTYSSRQVEQECTPWYKTKKWIIIFVIALIVVIAAAVGGGVGGTRHKNHNDDSVNGGSSSGAGPAPEGAPPANSTPSGSSTIPISIPAPTPEATGNNTGGIGP